jgi:RNA polymerase sigma factor (sigma-70 family)
MPRLLDKRTVHDPALVPLVEAADEAARRSAIERIVVSARPLIDRIVARSRPSLLRDEDADDVVAATNLRLVHRLRGITARSEPILSFHDFVAAVAYHAIYDAMRCRFPQRTRLKNRLRYVLTRAPRLAMWSTPSGSAAGLRDWNRRNVAVARACVDKGKAPAAALDSRRAAQAVEAILTMVGHPLLFDDLVDLTAELWDVADRSVPERRQPLIDESASAEQLVASRESLAMLWEEIQALPRAQRAALLLNVRDDEGGNGVALLVLTGIATFDDVAASVEIPARRLAALWNDLPLDDLRIASILGLTRQQVINLRKAARARLARRMLRKERGRR